MVFAVDKPAGITSHDVVDEVRRALGGAKAGHAGTLDPQATGVLVICLGAATKISSFLIEGEKEYIGRGRLGTVTDTQDAAGETIEVRSVTCDESAVRAGAARYVGAIRQIPPMFSAVKIGGQKLYRLARRGVSIERPARPVHVHAFEILHVELPSFDFRIRCSKGTYVRSVVHDLGVDLGCGGHLERLRRTRQGLFDLEASLPWESLIDEGAPEAIRARAVTPATALAFLPERPLTVPRPALRAGVFLPSESTDSASPYPGASGSTSVRLVHHGETVAIARGESGGHRVLHVLPQAAGRPPRREMP